MLRFLALLLVLVACVDRPAVDASGEEIYAQLCSRCHGDALQGVLGPGLGEGSPTASQPDEFIRVTVMHGKGRMPSMEGVLTDEQLEGLIAYIRGQQ